MHSRLIQCIRRSGNRCRRTTRHSPSPDATSVFTGASSTWGIDDIGTKHGISAERVRQLEREAIAKLRRLADPDLAA